VDFLLSLTEVQQKEAFKSLFLGRDSSDRIRKETYFSVASVIKSQAKSFRRRLGKGGNATMLVICLLRSIIEDQLLEVEDLGIVASSLPEASIEDINNVLFNCF